MQATGEYTNFMEIRVAGLQRSGNHAIVDWILEQHRGKKSCFLNNVRHGNHDPYETAEQTYFNKIGNAPSSVSVRSAYKHVLVYSYEDVPEKMQSGLSFVRSVYDHDFDLKRKFYLGSSQYFYDIIILRDPFNFFASRLKKLDSLTGSKDLETIKQDWKSLARQALPGKNNNSPNRMIINYNRWFTEKRYRQKLSRKLQGSFSDASLSSVPSIGGGSSFDSTAYGRVTMSMVRQKWRKFLEPGFYLNFPYYCRRTFAPGAQNMKVLERWQELRANQCYQKLFSDRELFELSEAIFGHIPGTRDFVRRCREMHP